VPKIKFITLENLLEMFANKEKFRLVEVLSEENFKNGHIPGAINLPFDKLEVLAKEHLEKTDTIVVYCGSYACQTSTRAAKNFWRWIMKKRLILRPVKRDGAMLVLN
jgi:rhodanese-related sulfurtransferase